MMTDQVLRQETLSIPAHLRPYTAVQRYDAYSAVDHAVWRYVMRRNLTYLKHAAHPAYLTGLSAAGITVDAIPSVARMHRQLAEVGWGAVVVDGLIPSTVFFDFQARGLLPISVDIRTLQHIEYTPAPDIIHEAAGHAPLLTDERFGSFVKEFGRIGAKALGTKAGSDVFDALRRLTILMESPDSTPEEIAEAERILAEKRQLPRPESEESWVSRLYWWTVEYGLIGSLQQPKIYGAGLLSSVSEGKNCLTDSVCKLPFNLEDCIHTRYDVTKPQPQLFVCESFDELSDAAKQLSERMAFRTGGLSGLRKAIQAGRTATAEFSSGLQVSGVFAAVREMADRPVYLQTTGPTALAVGGTELSRHGTRTHKDGFGSPIGKLSGASKALEWYTGADLDEAGIREGHTASLSFEGGVEVCGLVEHIHRFQGRVILISFQNCTVEYNGEVLFAPGWGRYDMAVGEQIVSVYAGAADPEAFFDVPGVVPEPVLVESQSGEADLRNRLHQIVRDIREGRQDEVVLRDVLAALDRHLTNDWLLRLEVLELLLCHGIHNEDTARLLRQLRALQADPELSERIASGLALLPISP